MWITSRRQTQWDVVHCQKDNKTSTVWNMLLMFCLCCFPADGYNYGRQSTTALNHHHSSSVGLSALSTVCLSLSLLLLFCSTKLLDLQLLLFGISWQSVASYFGYFFHLWVNTKPFSVTLSQLSPPLLTSCNNWAEETVQRETEHASVYVEWNHLRYHQTGLRGDMFSLGVPCTRPARTALTQHA